MSTRTVQGQIGSFGRNCTVNLNSNMANMNLAQMNDLYERINLLSNSERKSRKNRKQA